MQREDFDFDLPDELIARYPAQRRSDSRLMHVTPRAAAPGHHVFRQLPELLAPGDLLVCNDTRVIPARLYGVKRDSGGRVEILVERLVDDRAMLAQCRASKAPRAGTVIRVEDGASCFDFEVVGREDDFFRLQLRQGRLVDALERAGHMPLPPYIDRADEAVDRDRYQTVYGSRPGSVAAPTAGLHFDDELLEALDAAGLRRVFVTLHVGAGTFQPVRSDDIRAHRMHAEYLEVDEAVCAAAMETWARGGRVVAVGTTAVRSLETAAAEGELRPYRGDTRIFIYPPYRFRAVDMLITNFHLPQSTLLMLVSAFAGRERMLDAYAEAVRERYRFFSYGDAMLLEGLQPAALAAGSG